MTNPVGKDALAGSCTAVVKPSMAIGTIAPPDSVETYPTDCGRLGVRPVTCAAGPVTIYVRVSTRIAVTVTAGEVTVTVVVPTL